MKKIGITLRVDVVKAYSERRDSIDQKWISLLTKIDYTPILLPNIEFENIPVYLRSLDLDGVLLTGGNSLATLKQGNTAIERDKFELELLKYAEVNKIPVAGICRGMQIINHYFGGELRSISNHIGVSHDIVNIREDYNFPQVVNSFHQWGISKEDLAPNLVPLALDKNGYIEAISHKEKSFLGIMWHPERENPFNELDLQLIKRFFG